MKLILAEKPSVAKNIADALKIKTKRDGFFEGNGYLVTWAFGHLLELYDAKDYNSKMARWRMDYFPFIPGEFQYKVKSNPRKKGQIDAGAAKQLRTIKTLATRSDVDMIISACDYDREGQLIGDSIIENIQTNKLVYRLLLNEWTAEEILRGMNQIKPNSVFKPLHDAGKTRQWTDWIIGINLTSVATLKFQKGKGKVLNIGRVLLPTLKIIYDRDKEIEQFVPEDYFKLVANFQTADKHSYQGIYTINGKERFSDKDKLIQLEQALQTHSATIISKEVDRKKEFPPFLFNLSNLQGYITNKYQGWTSDKVLKVAQTLYEKKLITYPRTSSTALDESLVGKAAKVLEGITADLPYRNEVKFIKSKRVFNNAKVESHSAIIPTYIKPKQLSADQLIVYQAIKNRFIMQFMPVAIYEETKLITQLSDKFITGEFVTKGKVQLVEGWKKVEGIQSKDTLLPNVQLKEKVDLLDLDVTDHVTKPPKHHTEKTLLRVMETCGKSYAAEDSEDEQQVLTGFSIGTPATRAETIKKLKQVGYITNKKKHLICTELGKKLVETFPVQELFDLEFTGKLEQSLADIEKNKRNMEDFLPFIYSFTNQAVTKIKEEKDVALQEGKVTRVTNDIIGNCPLCGHIVIEGRKGFGCSNWKQGCSFVVWKHDKFLSAMKKKVTKTMVTSLLKNRVVYVKGLTSKNGKKFNAYLRYEKNDNNRYFSWRMDFKK
ncbi:type IA DNA topoisomerase [Aquibacillus albus]|uniref:DNA topoisomerase n=1 Tax=Aquibacillus albus TaxID=1168171 RepID=A0ABS2N5R3_9BACI|nr:type IA DNA topoisomerase [Aquibacillus albus]MBM7573225.1 DNA topoisomerase-3 [Aquibacillus albus]